MNHYQRRATIIASVFAVLMGSSTLAVAENIYVGQTAGFSGPDSATARALNAGAKVWIDAVNAKGGVNGNKIVLDAVDDGSDPKNAAENADMLIGMGAHALFLSGGKHTTAAVIPVAGKAGVPLIAPQADAMAIQALSAYSVFNVRSNYQSEAERAVQHLFAAGKTRIGVVHVDGNFGKDGLAGAERGFTGARLKPLWVQTFDQSKPELASIVLTIAKSDVQAVLLIADEAQAADVINGARAAGSNTQFISLSNNASSSFANLLGANARGVMVTQVFPDSKGTSRAVQREYQQLSKDAGIEPTLTGLEGFVSAKVLTEGLRRASVIGPITSENIIAAMNSMSNFDMGGMQVSYTPFNHGGLDFIEISTIGANGDFM